jgi:uncharacterized protein (DUF885 family)
MRVFLSIVMSAGLALGVALSAQGPSPPAAATTRLADDYVAAVTERDPETATFIALPNARNDRIYDNSPAAERAWDRRIDGFVARLKAIDSSALAGRPEAVTYGFLRQELDAEVGRRVCHGDKWAVNQLFGWQTRIPGRLLRQPIATPADRQAALTRLRQYPTFIDQEIANLRAGLKDKYSSPRGNVERVIAQIDALKAGDPVDSPFAAFARESDDAAFRQSVTEIVAAQINPALGRYRTFLGEYQGVARTDVGVSALPQGDACYRALVAEYTTVSLTADEVHQLGLTVMEQIHAEMRGIAERRFSTSDVPAMLQRVRADPSLRFTTADEIRTTASSAIARARAAMPKYFGRLPKADVVLQPFPDFEAAGSPPPQYRQPSIDGSRPGSFMINLLTPQQTSTVDLETVAFHESIPGHHLQIALAQEQQGAHVLTQILGSTAFIEGWGLYAERLADEMGLYSGDLDRLGMLSAQAWRAARLVVDTGIHSKQWTRQQAVDYMLRNTAVAEPLVQSEVDRYIIMPGQALAYMIGQREIQAQRAKAEAALGSRFDIRGFHDAVLGRGAVTLPMLREQIGAWIATVQSRQ